MRPSLPVNEDGGSGSVGLALRREAAEAIGFSGRCESDDECSRYLAVHGRRRDDVADAVAPYLSDDVALVEPVASGAGRAG